MNSLQDIGLKYGTDKATYHMYLDFYEKHIDPLKVDRFLEIGVQGGFSIRTWREWFPDTTVIEGWDINPSDPIEGCDLRIVDQLSKEQMAKNITGTYDIILDDGGHTAEMIQTSFSYLFRYSKMYIIEDLHAPWCGAHFMSDSDINTLDMLEDFATKGWTSQYATDEEREYINKNAEIIEFFVRGDRSSPLSASCVVRNNAFDV